jgi:hypothetical protein
VIEFNPYKPKPYFKIPFSFVNVGGRDVNKNVEKEKERERESERESE